MNDVKYKIVVKAESCLMRFIGSFFGFFGIMTKKRFMENYTTTIGNTIYAPYGEIGHITLVHEKLHIKQYVQNKLFYSLRYLISKKWRARYEVEAYLGSQPRLGLDKLIEILKPYRCRPKDVEHFWYLYSDYGKKT